MKRTALVRKTPLKRGNSTLKTTTPLARGTARLTTTKPLKASGKPMRTRKRKADKPKRAARNAGPINYLELCRGPVGCFLLIPGHAHHGRETTDPCHSNQSIHGKGMSLKALDIHTVPGCRACHQEMDQGHRFTREEKFAIWDAAYARWEPVRAAKIAAQAQEKLLLSGDIKPDSTCTCDIRSYDIA